MKIIISVLLILGLWSTNNFYLNKVSQSERELKKIENELESLKREHSIAIMTYDKGMDIDQIKKKLESQGMKVTRDINFFKIQETDK